MVSDFLHVIPSYSLRLEPNFFHIKYSFLIFMNIMTVAELNL